MEHRILIVDDNDAVRRNIAIALKRDGYLIKEARTGDHALKLIKKNNFDVIISDVRMEGNIDGLEVLEFSRRYFPDVGFILMTAYGTVDDAVRAIRNGAYEYVEKPFREEQLKLAVKKAIEHNSLRMRVRQLERQWREKFGLDHIITANGEMQGLIKKAIAVASTESNILITGESGTGKELIAGVIHTCSDLKDRPFVPVNCGGLPEQLLESELFGHVKGAFTGAVSYKRGLVEEADGGTLFLDEIAETSQALQVKLLRFVQNGEIRRVGDNETRYVKVRIIAATNRNLVKAMESGAFREDLYYRIAVIPLHLPPLRDRAEDIPLLAQHFLRRYSTKLQKNVENLTPRAMDALKQYHWPGNVRELMNAIEHGVALCVSRELDIDLLPQRLLSSLETMADGNCHPLTLEEVEKNHILRVLSTTNWNQKKACEILNLSKATLYRRLKAYGIKSPRELPG